MNICPGKPLSRDGHELLDELVVLFPTGSRPSKTQIQFIVQQGFVLSAS